MTKSNVQNRYWILDIGSPQICSRDFKLWYKKNYASLTRIDFLNNKMFIFNKDGVSFWLVVVQKSGWLNVLIKLFLLVFVH